MLFHAGGISNLIALNKSTPPSVKTSNILSRLFESEPPIETRGFNSLSSGIFEVLNILDLACDQFLLALMVLISPLCASILNG